MKINCIAIDDEPLALAKIVAFASKVAELNLLKTFDNAIDAISYLKENAIDLIFLDIQMEEFTGIQFLETVRQRPLVIITSAYGEYALKGFELNVADYLLKPYSFERFLQSVNKILDLLKPRENFKSDFLFVKTEYRLERINFDQILYIEGKGDYLLIVTNTQKTMTLQNFKYFEEMLPAERFQRVHKSFMVANDKIESIERNLIKIKNQLIPVGSTYKEAFFKSLHDKLPPKYSG